MGTEVDSGRLRQLVQSDPSVLEFMRLADGYVHQHLFSNNGSIGGILEKFYDLRGRYNDNPDALRTLDGVWYFMWSSAYVAPDRQDAYKGFHKLLEVESPIATK